MKSAKEKKEKRVKLIILLLLLIFGVSIGYSLLSGTLNITGISRIYNATWDVHFENPTVTEKTNIVAEMNPIANSYDKKTDVTYTISLDNPGDIYEFTIDVVNKGSVDARLSDMPKLVGLSNEQRKYTKYTFTHADNTPVEAGEIIASGKSSKFLVHVEYIRNLQPQDLPETTQNMTLSVELNYEQA